MAAVCVLGSYAQYIYTPTAKFKIQGDNIVKNGNFTEGTGLDGWTNADGGAINGSVYSVVTGVEVNGQTVNAVEAATAASDETNITIANVWANLAPGLYSVSYWIKGAAAAQSAIAAGTANYLNFFVNADGSSTVTRPVSDRFSISAEWKQVVDTVNIESGDFLVFNASGLAAGTQITGFAIQAVQEVYDTRIAERRIAYFEKLLAEPMLAEGADEILGMLEAVVKPALADPSQNENAEAMSELMNQFATEFDAFMDNKGGNLIGIYLTDWKTWGAYNWNRLSNIGTWTFEGGRWGFSPNDASRERPAGDGYVAAAGIQTGQSPLNVGLRTKDDVLATLPAGVYLFAIEAQAVSASLSGNASVNWLYGANDNVPIVGPMIYVGNDSTTLENDTLNGYYWKRYYKIAEIKEGESVRAGFHFPLVDESVYGKVGGRYSLRNPEMRLLGESAEALMRRYNTEQLKEQQNALKIALDTYPTDLAAYKWEQDSLNTAVALATEVYNNSIAVVDAEGNVLQPEQVTAELVAAVKAEMTRMNNARSWVINQNKSIDNLTAAIAAANTSYNAEANVNAGAAERTAFKAVIDEAQGMIDAISAVNQAKEFDAEILKIQDAQQVFEATTARRSNPSVQALVNIDFKEFSSGTKLQTSTNKGWNWTVGTDANQWQLDANTSFEAGICANMYRGTTVAPHGRAQQTFKIKFPGVYEYRAKAYAYDNERIGEYLPLAEVIYEGEGDEAVGIDTVFVNTPVKLFFGQVGAPDSIRITKAFIGLNGGYDKWGWGSGADYAVYFVKEGNDEIEMEIGFECANNVATSGVNTFGFGDNQVLYVGPVAEYTADTKADMDAVVTTSKTYVNNYAAAENEWIKLYANKMKRFIKAAETATTIKDMQNIYLSLTELQKFIDNQINTEVKGIVVEETAKPAPKGVYTFSGVKIADKAEGLQPGLYIIDGVKTAVK